MSARQRPWHLICGKLFDNLPWPFTPFTIQTISMNQFYVCKAVRFSFLYCCALFLLPLSLFSQPAGTPVLNFQSLTTGLSAPLDVVNAGDGSNRLFIVQRGGLVRIFNGTTLLPAPFINLADTVLDNGEQGLLSLAFHPDYSNNRYFFVWYTDKEGDLTLARYQASSGNPNTADQQSEVVLLEIPKPGTPYFTNHNGGKLNFGNDGYLYVSIGDGGNGGDPFNNSQNGNSLFGKMLRIDVDNINTPPYYSIPPDNPYVSNPSVRDEIWALGLRNPWRWSFDRLTQDMWIADVGQGSREEINFRSAGNTGGINYGWRCYEGNSAYNTSGCGASSNYVLPIFDYPHNNSTGGYSVTGGLVYRGSQYPLLTGWYVCADYVSGNVWKIYPNGSNWIVSQQTGLPGGIAGFGEGENGALYAVSLNAGALYEVQATTSLPARLVQLTATRAQNSVRLEWSTSYEAALNRFDIEYSEDGSSFTAAGSVPATNLLQGSRYRYDYPAPEDKDHYFRVKIVDQDGQFAYSRILAIPASGTSRPILTPTVISNQSFTLNTSFPVDQLLIFAYDGKLVWSKSMAHRQGASLVELPGLRAGIYVVHIISNNYKIVERITIQ